MMIESDAHLAYARALTQLLLDVYLTTPSTPEHDRLIDVLGCLLVHLDAIDPEIHPG